MDAEVFPVPAASVILLRDEPMEALMILRHERSSFVPNAWVFPGGAVDPSDGPAGTLEAMVAAARRELAEETGIESAEDFVWTSRWITPAGLPKRFDTWFFLSVVPRHTEVRLQEAEAVDSTWISPADALQRQREGSFPMVFPTIKNLQAIAAYTSAAELLASRRGARIEPVQPRMIREKGKVSFVLP